jgi:hypothetical protein
VKGVFYKEYLNQFIGKGCNFNQSGEFAMLDVGTDPQYHNEPYILSKVHEDFVILENNPNRAEGTEVLPTIAVPLSSIKISIQGH